MGDSAMYSAFGLVELKCFRDHLGLCEGSTLDTVLACWNGYEHWQYGSESHACLAQTILRSTVMEANSNNGLLG